jgi:antitoxin component of RelBE/YafQ-DinJ toxin-antitoxin module
VKQHLAAIRMMFDWLATRGMLPFNPVTAGRAKHVTKRVKHQRGTHAGLRDRALVGLTALYSA